MLSCLYYVIMWISMKLLWYEQYRQTWSIYIANSYYVGSTPYRYYEFRRKDFFLLVLAVIFSYSRPWHQFTGKHVAGNVGPRLLQRRDLSLYCHVHVWSVYIKTYLQVQQKHRASNAWCTPNYRTIPIFFLLISMYIHQKLNAPKIKRRLAAPRNRCFHIIFFTK